MEIADQDRVSNLLLEGLWVGGVTDGDITNDILGLVRSVGRPAVPVVRHTLLALLPDKVVVITSDTEEGLEVVAVKVTSWGFGRVVAHEIDHLRLASASIDCRKAKRGRSYEVVSCWDDNHSGESAGDVVGVVLNRLVLSFFKLGPELVQCVTVRTIIDRDIIDLLKASDVE